MKTCMWCTGTEGVNVICTNYVNLRHLGRVPIELCNVCPFDTLPTANDFFKQTNKLLLHKQLVGEYVANPKPCSGCQETKINEVKTAKGVKTRKAAVVKRRPVPQKEVVPMPISKPRDWEWVCVVTTAPRAVVTVEESVQSIKAAGWSPIVFAEPESVVVEGVRYHHNETRLGAFHNWLQAIKYATTKTNAKYILSAQDDVVLHPDSREFVEGVMFPSRNTGFISLYTPRHYSMDLSGNLKPLGVRHVQTGSLWGACALVFEHSVLVRIIDHVLTQNWTGIAPSNLSQKEKNDLVEHKKLNPYLIQNVDTLIGKVINSLHLEMYFVDPSPAEHISVVSSIGHGGNTGKRNCLRKADFTKPLREQVLQV